MSQQEYWRGVARRRQRQRPVKELRWFVPDPAARAILVLVFLPLVVLMGFVIVAAVLNSSRLVNVTVLLAVGWLVGSWLFCDLRRRRVKGIDPSGSEMLGAGELEQRVDAEISGDTALLSGTVVTPMVATLMWSQYGNLLLEREHQVRALAGRSSWKFDPFDLLTSAALDQAGVTAFTPSTCRNVCRGQQRQEPFILTDLTRTRYDLETFDRTQQVELLTASMCVLPFAAPQELRIVARSHWLADIPQEYEPVSTESAAFNAAYRILGQNNLWTRLVLNPGFLDLLMASSVTSLVIDGGRFAVAVEPWQPIQHLAQLLELSSSLHYSALTASAPEADEPIAYFT